MMRNLLILAVLGAVGYWYWNGPYQARHNPSYAQKLDKNDAVMRLCIRTVNYKAGATGLNEGDPETVCANKHNVYFDEGHWHSYSDTRPD